MSGRARITKKLTEVLKTITIANGYNIDIYPANVSSKMVFWDECNDFPFIAVSPGPESREYHPGGFAWGFISASIKVYVKSETPADDLEKVLEDVENCIVKNERLEYETGQITTELLIDSIITDEGLLAPYGVGEINITIRYQVR